MPELLNASQYTSLTVALRGFERNLREAALWLSGSRPSGTLYHARLNMSPERWSAALSLIAEALEAIAQLADALGLEAADEDLGRKIVANMSIDWADLGDVSSARLSGYGAVDPRLGELLDPYVERLAQLALSIASLAGEKPT